MAEWGVKYTTTEGESCSVWVEAETKEEAEQEVREEYWDVESIQIIRKI